MTFNSTTKLKSRLLTAGFVAGTLAISGTSIAAPDKHLFVLVGGYGSCAAFGEPSQMNMRDSFDWLASNKRSKGSQVETVSACYALSSSTLFIETPSGEVLRADLETLNQLMGSYVGKASIHLIGQSHGGWTVMMSALSLPAGSLATLVTIDPISLTECTSFDWTGSWLGSIFGADGAAGCTESTSDLVPYFSRIKASTSSWIHFWQDENELLHASDIPQASKRYYLNYADGNSDGYAMGAHGRTEVDPAIWTKIWESLSKR